MNCEHVQALIDAVLHGPGRPAQLAAVERHASACPRCRPVLEAARALDSDLRRLPEPAPPAGLATAILARTAQEDEPLAAPSRGTRRVHQPGTRSDRRAWAAMLGGALTAIGAETYRWLVGESTLHLTEPVFRRASESLAEMSRASPAVLVLAAGLLLAVAGLFAPLHGPSTPPSAR